jgi:hypothetical protein
MALQEWDGRGREEAVAWSFGRWGQDLDEIVKGLRRLGMDVRSADQLELVHGHVCIVGEDVIYDACDEEGYSLYDPFVAGDTGSIEVATFVYFATTA